MTKQHTDLYSQEWCPDIESLETDLAAKNLEVGQLKTNVGNLESDLSKKDQRGIQLESDLESLQSEFDIKLKDLDSLKDEHQALIKQYRQLVEKENVKGHKEQDSEVFSQFDSLEFDPKVCNLITVIHMHIP